MKIRSTGSNIGCPSLEHAIGLVVVFAFLMATLVAAPVRANEADGVVSTPQSASADSVADDREVVAHGDSRAADDKVTAEEVHDVLRDHGEKEVAKASPSKADGDSAAVVSRDHLVVDVPREPQDGVTIDVGEVKLNVSLPNAEDAGSAKKTSNGVVVYPSKDGAASAVVPTSEGAQFLTTIANAEAPIRYDYRVTVPSGAYVELRDGGAAVVDSEGAAVTLIPVPWAKDSAGRVVPTRFETDGVTLTQVVDHTQESFSYPIVADPWFLAAVVGAIRTAAGGCVLGAVGSMGWEAMKWGLRRGDWRWNARLTGAADACLQAATFGGAGRFLDVATKRWVIWSLRNEIINYVRWTLR